MYTMMVAAMDRKVVAVDILQDTIMYCTFQAPQCQV